MTTGSDNTALLIPDALLAEIWEAAEREHRSVDDVLRDVMSQGLNEYRQAHALGLPDADLPLTDAYRQVLREAIAQGLASARAGRLVDGEGVFSRIEAEMVELERQGRV